jgi:hypothetical protein
MSMGRHRHGTLNLVRLFANWVLTKRVQVSSLPIWIYALLSDPGGVLNTCLCVFRTAAFRLIDGVGFPINNTDGYPLHNFVLLVHNIADFGAPLHGLHSCSPWLRTPVTGLTRKVRYCPVG